MIYSWISFFVFLVAGLIHFGFFTFEVFYLPRQKVYTKLGYTDEAMKFVKVWAFNVGIYNLCLGLITFYGLYKVVQRDIFVAGALITASGVTMIMAGIALWFSTPKLRKFALLQGLPPLVGFIFLALHVLERMGKL